MAAQAGSVTAPAGDSGSQHGIDNASGISGTSSRGTAWRIGRRRDATLSGYHPGGRDGGHDPRTVGDHRPGSFSCPGGIMRKILWAWGKAPQGAFDVTQTADMLAIESPARTVRRWRRERCTVLMRVISGEMTMEAAADEPGNLASTGLHEPARYRIWRRCRWRAWSRRRPAARRRLDPMRRISASPSLEAELGRTPARSRPRADPAREIALAFGDRLGSKKLF